MKTTNAFVVVLASALTAVAGGVDFEIEIKDGDIIRDISKVPTAPIIGYAGVMCEGGAPDYLLVSNRQMTARAFRESGAWLLRQWSANAWWQQGYYGRKLAKEGKTLKDGRGNPVKLPIDPHYLFSFLKQNNLKALFTLEQWGGWDVKTAGPNKTPEAVKRGIVDYLTWIKENGYEGVVAGFELGNETYFNPHPEPIATNWCAIVPEIKRIMPNVKLGIPLGEYVEDDPDFQAVARRWRTAEQQAEHEKMDVDLDRVRSVSARFIRELRPVMKDITHVIYHGYGAEKPFSATMYGFNRWRKFRDAFPETKGKPIWVTEWRERSDEDVRCHRRFNEGLWRAHFLMMALSQTDIEALNLHGFDCQAGAFNWAHDGAYHVQWDTACRNYPDCDWIPGEERLETGLTGVIYRYFAAALRRFPVVIAHGDSKGKNTNDSLYTCTRFYQSVIQRRLDIEQEKDKLTPIDGDVEWLALADRPQWKNANWIALLMVNSSSESKRVRLKLEGKDAFQPIYRTLTCDEAFVDRNSVPGETKPWRTMAWEADSVPGKRYNGWEWGPLQPRDLIVEIGPKTIQTVTIPLERAKK